MSIVVICCYAKLLKKLPRRIAGTPTRLRSCLRSGRQCKQTGLCAAGSSCPGTPGSLAQRFSRNEPYGCGMLLAGARPTGSGEPMVRRCPIYFLGWQEPLIGHCAQPHPQEDFPFFLFFTMLTIIAVTMAIKTAQIMIAAIFSESQASIFFPPVLPVYFITLTPSVSFAAS